MLKPTAGGSRYSLFTTWILWRYLLEPGGHPLFRREMKLMSASGSAPSLVWIAPLLGVLVCGGLWALLIRAPVSVAIGVLVTLTAFSTVYVGDWAARTSYTIARSRQLGMFDVFCLSPSGTLGASWAIGNAVRHHADALGWITFFRQVISVSLLLVLLMALGSLAARQNAANSWPLARLLLDILALTLVSYLEHIQAVVMGSLIGMMTPVFTSARFEAYVWAAVGWLLFQVLSLLASILAVIASFPDGPLLDSGVFDNIRLSPTLLILLTFTLTREMAIIALWRVLTYHFGSHPADLEADLMRG